MQKGNSTKRIKLFVAKSDLCMDDVKKTVIAQLFTSNRV